AVVCGAWHAPLLDLGGSDSVRLPDARADAALLEGLPALNVQAAWTPWTHGRLLAASGYGAGIASPGWYDHLWSTPDQIVVRWLARVARLLRAEGLDVSAAYLIEAARLAEALATLRGQPLPGLLELNDACRAVLAAGDDTPLRLIQEKLIVGEALGAVPEEAPTVPLQQDLQREQKRLRLPPEATQRLLELDLRQPAARERSELLHRLDLLGIDWGSREAVRGAAGTFHEPWRLQWRPELAVAVVEAAVWGNTVADAASARAGDLVAHSTDLAALLAVLDRCLAAGLPDAVRAAVARVEELAALSGDVERLLEALPPLANILRYGSVRRLDTALVGGVIDGIVPRIGIGLPGACTALNDESAATMRERIAAATRAIAVLQRADHEAAWHAALLRLADQAGMHGLIAGHCCRTLLDARRLQGDEAARRLGLALSPGNEPSHAAAWVQGFLEGSGLLLLHDEALWRVLDRWVTALPGEAFVQVLPLLRRTFSTFAPPERQRLGERVRGADPAAGAAAFPFDEERAASVVPLLARLLGVPLEGQA
ncbi:MAG TPA: DUF5682 family protein, partial [Dehalococcoidia bacterium]|nr:DUF5682 family protein [Dehalococcoidia bacterium]